jgi:hypothetical protein
MTSAYVDLHGLESVAAMFFFLCQWPNCCSSKQIMLLLGMDIPINGSVGLTNVCGLLPFLA